MKRIPEQDLRSLTSALTNLENFVFLESSKVSENDHHSMLFTDPLDWLVCTIEDPVELFLEKCERWRKEGKYLAGWIAYEFGYLLEPTLHHFCGPHFRSSPASTPLAVLGVFDQPVIFDHSTNLFLNNKPWPTTPTEDKGSYEISDMQTNIGRNEYLSAINRIKQYIAAGHTYQVNYTMKLKFDFSGSVAALYHTLRRNQSVSYGAWIRHDKQDIMSLSPELFYRADKENITVRPMKGTLVRGRTTKEDNGNRSLLQNDPKNRSENIMIVDLLRNDLGRLLYEIDGGRIQPRSLFDIETYETLLQMTSTIEGRLKSDKQPGFQDVIKAIFPCGSITGAPKIRTMEIIHELEKEERGVYCGAIGYSGPDETVFNVPIRTVVLKDGWGEMGVGSGIIHDSDPEGEWQESLLKGNFLTRPTPEFQLIETILWQPDSGYWLLEEHLQRLTDSALYFQFSYDVQEISQALTATAATLTKSQRVRLLLYRDGGLEITTTELPDTRGSDPLKPLVSTPLPVVSFSRQQINPDSRYLFHKTTMRKTYDDARKLATEQQLFEILFTNNKDEVTEGSISNIFIEKDSNMFTPPLQSGLLNGTFRRFLLDHGTVQERILKRQDIDTADIVYVGNSIRGLVQVTVRPEDC
ncbi:MAG: aminodeoxychorismate synthase component I [Desulfobulbaceae bacterium]|nr:aminodeoxychorismate synthase component I [Desulfobulbaceae bacterium]